MTGIGSKLLKGMLAVALPLLMCAGAASAATVTYNLRASATTVTMADGSSVLVWGYADMDAGDVVTVPGPTLYAVAGDTLVINLTHDLPSLETTSFMIHGQIADSMAPSMMDGKLFSFVEEATFFDASPVTYTYTGVKEGTYLYESGTHSQVQVPIGMYGALVVYPDAGGGVADMGTAYGQTYDNVSVLVLSEMDAALNTAQIIGDYGIAGGSYPSTVQYAPQYYLINGEDYPDTADVGGISGQTTLLRLVNAGSDTYVPTIQGLEMTVIAEDGFPVSYPYATLGPSLHAGKTMDVLVTPATPGNYALHDARNHLSADGEGGGGMLTFFNVPGYAGGLTGLELVPNPGSPQLAGTNVSWTANALTSVVSTYEFRFRLRGPATGGTWQTVRNYSTGNTWDWTTTSSDIGQSRVLVLARPAGSAASVPPTMTIAKDFVVSPGVTLQTSLPSPVAQGTAVTFTAVGAGGVGGYQYRFRVRGPGTGFAWQTVVDYTAGTNVFVWTPGLGDIGQTRILVLARAIGSGQTASAVTVYTVQP